MSEFSEQVALLTWARWRESAVPELGLLFHIPNGERRDKVTAGRLHAMGVRPGVPDLFLPVARPNGTGGVYLGLWIELKAAGGRLRAEQVAWQDALTAQGYCVHVCYGWLQARDVICRYLDIAAEEAA